MIGVDQSTLRRWSDAGKIPVFRTPGGHRRYSETSLRQLVGDGTHRDGPPDDAVTPADRTTGIDEDRLVTARERRWYRALSQATLDDLRRFSRRLTDLATRYVVAQSGSADRARALGEARQIGDAYGRVSAASGLSPSESVEAFLYFRTPVIRTAITMADDAAMPARGAVRIQVELGQFWTTCWSPPCAAISRSRSTAPSPEPSPPVPAGASRHGSGSGSGTPWLHSR